ncbi:MAG: biopolymer transporter ExbD [Burkholderiales bacterium]
MNMTPRERRAERRSRNQNMVDMNLVSLIDVFTILIFFLLSNSGGVETLPSPKAVKLPESLAQTQPRDTIVVVVSGTEIIVDGRKVASVADVIDAPDDMIEGLKAELDLQASRQVIRKENETKGKTLTIMGDKDIPYRLLRKIMYTSARANFSDVSFAVRQRFES